MGTEKYSVRLENFENEFSHFEPGVVKLTRHQTWHGSEWLQTDVSSHFWGFAFFDVEPGNFFFLREGIKYPVSKTTAFYLPPFSIFSTLTLNGFLSWRAYFSFTNPPSAMPQEPILMNWASNVDPTSSSDFWLEALRQQSSWRSVGLKGEDSNLAYKVKSLIDNQFEELKSINEYCREVGASHEVVDRVFKKCFGLTPQLYRRKLRTTEALALMVLKGFNVSRASVDVGYLDTDNFSKQFKKTFLGRPSQFRPPKGFTGVSI